MNEDRKIRFGGSLSSRLDALAWEKHQTKTFGVRKAVEREIDNREWEDGVLQVWEDIKAGRAATVPHNVMRARLGLAD